MRHIFIIGSKGIPGNYGGYETFVDKLTEYHARDPELRYHVACKNTGKGDFLYHNADCFEVKVPPIGPAQAVWYDLAAMGHCLRTIRQQKIPHPVVYILACRIGPWTAFFRRKLHALGGELFINPDGHEWLRSKWPLPVRKYWKLSEKLMVKNADLVICDSKNIRQYIQKEYAAFSPATAYISYGSEIAGERAEPSEACCSWLRERDLQPGEYYLIVGRFVPENNYETMLREFMASSTRKKLVLITDAGGKFLESLQEKLHFEQDERIVFAGTVYDQPLLREIRQNAFAYIHGHEVGGTNPSLLEALGSTDLNLLLDVGFNREVAETAALYWSREEGSLSGLLEQAEALSPQQIHDLGLQARARIRENYSWPFIAETYKRLFLDERKSK